MTEFTSRMPDCLVFKFEECSDNKDTTIIYVIYDNKNHKYLIRGRRRWTPRLLSCSYSYECEYENDLVDFIQYLVCPDNKVNEILYNYDNLPEDPNEITFEFLNKNDHQNYEISGYNDSKLKRSRLLKNLRMLKNVFNYY